MILVPPVCMAKSLIQKPFDIPVSCAASRPFSLPVVETSANIWRGTQINAFKGMLYDIRPHSVKCERFLGVFLRSGVLASGDLTVFLLNHLLEITVSECPSLNTRKVSLLTSMISMNAWTHS